MIVPIANRHRVAGLIWAAIVVFGVQFLTNAALAHIGHHHDQHAVYQQGSVTDEGTAGEGIVGYRSAKLTANSKMIDTVLMVASYEAEPTAVSANCGCCGSGSGCCSASAIPGSWLALPGLDSPATVIAFKPVNLGSTDPQGLAKPPKNLA